MNAEVLKYWDANQAKLKQVLAGLKMEEISYLSLFTESVKVIFGEDAEYGFPDHQKITNIDNGDYQGTLVFVVGGSCYQPRARDHWYTSVGYGSCSGCDTLQSLLDYNSGLPNGEQVDGLWTLCLHMFQKLRRMED